MMASMSQAYSPHPPGLQHPGVAPGHPMAPGHPQQTAGQPGPGMPQQMHMGVSGPGGPQVTQAGAMLGVMPPGVGAPGGPSAHAIQHLNPSQAQIYQQQQAQMAFNTPQMHMAQQHMIHQQQQRQRQAIMAQQYNTGVPMNMPNGMATPMNPAQFNAMRAAAPNLRPVALPQHLQQQQQAAQMGLDQQQAAQQAQQQHQHQHMLAQQMALQQANAVQASANQGQPNQMGPQQVANLQNAQMAAQQQQQQAAQQQQQVTTPQNIPPAGQPQSQTQQPQQPQPQQQQQQQQPPQSTSQQPVPVTALMHQRPRDQIKGHCILRLVQFGDHLSQFVVSSKPIEMYMSGGAQLLDAQGNKQRDDLNYWSDFVEQFFSTRGVLRHSVLIMDERVSKQYEITYPALARYFYAHFESGIKNMQMITERAKEKELPNNYHYIESQKSSFIYWFENGSQLVANGVLRAQFDANQKIELLEFNTTGHEEFVSRPRIVEAARPLHEWIKEWTKVNSQPDGKQSPEMNKKGKPRAYKSPQMAPPEIDIPDSKVKLNTGITQSVFRFLELAEVMGHLNPLFQFSHQNSSLTPYNALEQYVATYAANGAPGMNGPNLLQSGQRTPGQFPTNQSPSVAHLGLPDNSAIGGSPAQGHMQAPNMALQQSQQGTSSSGPSANTSPNVTTKRRRPSVKTEGEEAAGAAGQTNGVQPKVKPSPRIGKRQKGNPP